MNDPYDLQRFVDAQQPVFDEVLRELVEGRKRTHWMWFVFPQIVGLGRSPMAVSYAISSREEAIAYLNHPVLGPRLRVCSRLVADIHKRSIEYIFDYPDCIKFRSSMTLFAEVAPDNAIFKECLRRYFGGKSDASTLAQLRLSEHS